MSIFYILAEKIERAVIVIKDIAKRVLRVFYEHLLSFLRKVAERFAQREGRRMENIKRVRQ